MDVRGIPFIEAKVGGEKSKGVKKMNGDRDAGTGESQLQPGEINRQALDRWIAQPGLFRNEAEHVAVLFADLVGSTAYKFKRSKDREIEGIAKPYRHNGIVEEVVEHQNYGGVLVKFCGDAAMAYFCGNDAACRGIEAALAIIRQFDEHNKRIPNNYEDHICTRIGLHYGPVWMMAFKQANRLDPQGTTVDIAYRLCAASPPMNVTLTKQTYELAGGRQKWAVASDTRHFRLKGIDEVSEVLTLTISGWTPDIVPLPGASEPLLPHIKQQLDAAWEAWILRRQAADAIKAYRHVLRDAPFCFEANYHLAELLVFEGNGSSDRPAELREAEQRLQVAKSARPETSRLWNLIGWVQYQQFREELRQTTTNDPRKNLERAIRDAEHALHIAQNQMDDSGAAEAKIYLAIYHSEWTRAGFGDEARHVQSARDYISQVQAARERGLGEISESNFFVAEALGKVTQGAGRSDEVLKLLCQAVERHPRNKLAVALYNELINP